MASKQSKFKRSFPFLLALVVLISCLPVVPVSAANSMTLEGVWEISSGWEQSFDEGRISFFEISVDAYVLIQGDKHRVTSIFIDEQEPQTLAVSSSLWSERAFESSGYTVTDDGCIYFSRPVTITDPGAIAFFTSYATQDTSQTYKLIVDDHEVHSHFYPWTSQSIVDQTGTTFECICGWEYIFTYSGEGVFNGFVDASGKKYFDQCIFNVSTAELRLTSTTTSSGGGSGSTESYTSTISIDGQEFTFTSTTEQPKISLQVTSNGASLSYGSQIKLYTFEGAGSFQGLSFSATGSAFFAPGQTYELSAGDHTLYPISSVSGGSGSLTATFLCLDSIFVFEGSSDALPEVTLTVTAEGFTLSSGDTYRYFEAPGIIGYKLDSTAEGYIAVGESVIFTPSHSTSSYAQRLYPVYSSDATYSTTVYVYNNIGELFDSFVFTAVGYAPSLTLTVTAAGLSLTDGVYTELCDVSHYYGPSNILGFATQPTLYDKPVSPTYRVGGSYRLLGSADDNSVYYLYAVCGDPDEHSDVKATLKGFVSSFITPVQVFFDTEFIPGFTFGRLGLVAFVLGLLFWFLKSSK